MLRLIVEKSCHQFWKRGAYNKEILERIITRLHSNDNSKNGKSCTKPKPKCPLPYPKCAAPVEEKDSPGRKKKQPELKWCNPECREGKPNLPSRGCLPWEKGIEICPENQLATKIQSPSCEHLCEPYIGHGFIDKSKITICEFRRFEKCTVKNRNPAICLELAPKLGVSEKEYPLMHAAPRKNIPGCAITLYHLKKPDKSNQGEDNCK